ncbi:MAG: hypothetical protein ABEN55_17645, partial [Bradymonadaceae bacterium]
MPISRRDNEARLSTAHRLFRIALVILVAGAVAGIDRPAHAGDTRRVEWEAVAGEPSASPSRTLADHFSGRLDQQAPEGVLAVLGDYRGGGHYQIADVDIAPDDRRMAIAAQDGYVYVWELATGQRVATWAADHTPREVLYSPDGTRVAVVAGYGRDVLTLRDASTGDVLWKQTIDSLDLDFAGRAASFESV